MDREGPGREDEPAIGGRHGRAVVAAEVFGVLLMLLATAGTCALLIAAHRRVAVEPGPVVVAAAPASGIGPEPIAASSPASEPEPAPDPGPEPPPPPLPAEPEVDPTAEALVRLDAERRSLSEVAERASRRLSSLGRDLDSKAGIVDRALGEAREASKRRASLVAEADRLEAEAQLVGLERDVLDRRRDQADRARREALERPGHAILPYRGPSGTWRRPIPVECANGSATLEPGGLSFSMVELMALPGRPGPFGAAVKRLARLIEAEGAPGGERVEPYVLFVVRPDGIRPFYEARSALDANGVPYGYELVDQEWEIEYPSWDDPTIWDSLDASIRSGELASAGVEPGGTLGEPYPDPLGPGGRFGGGGLDRGGSVPLGVPGPEELAGSLRSLGDLIPDLPAGVADPIAGSGLGAPGPWHGSLPARPEDGIGHGGMGGDDGSGGDPAGLAGRSGGASGMAGGAVPPGFGPGARGGMPGMPPSARSFATHGGGGPPGMAGMAGGVGGGGSPASGRPTVPGGGGGTGIGWNDGEPGMGPSGGLGPFGSGPSRPEGIGSDTGAGATGGAMAEGVASGTPGGAPGSSLRPDGQGGPGGSSSMGSGGSPGGGAFGADLGPTAGRIEFVVACGPKGVTIHPGGYKLSDEIVRKDDDRLARTLEAVLAARRRREPASARVPSLRFLVEPGGYGLYWAARAQVELSGLGWPITWQASEPRTFALFGSERW